MTNINPFQEPYLYRFFQSQSPAGTTALVANLGSSFQIFSKSGSNPVKQLTNEDKGSLIANISSDGKFVLAYFDHSGKEQGYWYRIEVSTDKKACLTPGLSGYTAFCIATAKQNPETTVSWILMEGENCILLVENLTQDHPKSSIIFKSKNNLSFPIISDSGDMVSFLESNNQKQILHVFKISDSKFQSFELEENTTEVNPMFFYDQTKTLIVKSNGTNKRIYIFNFQTQLFSELPVTVNGDLDTIDFDSQKSLLLFSATIQAKTTVHIFDFKDMKPYKISSEKGSYDYFLNGGYILKDEILIRWQSGNNPPVVRAINLKNKVESTKFSFQQNQLNLPEFKSISVKTTNGPIQAWLMLPKKNTLPVPMIIDLHGGPKSCALDEFSPEAQYFASNGFGICYLNYHGSTTFGTEFENSIIGHPGKLETQDIVNLKYYLVDEGFADNDKTYLQGWSWGGFVSLLAAGLHSNKFRAVVSVMGIGDLIASYKTQHIYLQKIDNQLFGGSPTEVRSNYSESSPINYVKNITSPILIIHGKNDQHCPAKQMQNFINELEQHGKEYQVKWHNYGHLEMYSSNKIREATSKDILDFYRKM